jgi:hypothetical protein
MTKRLSSRLLPDQRCDIAQKESAPIRLEDRSASRGTTLLLHANAQNLRCRLTHETHTTTAAGLGAARHGTQHIVGEMPVNPGSVEFCS